MTDQVVPVITIADQIGAVEREIGKREGFYPRWVKQGRLTQARADLELRTMRAVKDSLIKASVMLVDRDPGKLATGELFGPAKVRDNERQKVLAAVLDVAGQSVVYRTVALLQQREKKDG